MRQPTKKCNNCGTILSSRNGHAFIAIEKVHDQPVEGTVKGVYIGKVILACGGCWEQANSGEDIGEDLAKLNYEILCQIRDSTLPVLMPEELEE